MVSRDEFDTQEQGGAIGFRHFRSAESVARSVAAAVGAGAGIGYGNRRPAVSRVSVTADDDGSITARNVAGNDLTSEDRGAIRAFRSKMRHSTGNMDVIPAGATSHPTGIQVEVEGQLGDDALVLPVRRIRRRSLNFYVVDGITIFKIEEIRDDTAADNGENAERG
jgi:hypothetical protein